MLDRLQDLVNTVRARWWAWRMWRFLRHDPDLARETLDYGWRIVALRDEATD